MANQLVSGLLTSEIEKLLIRMEIRARLVYKAATLFSEPKTREELGRETVATVDSVVRFAIVEERQGDAFTGRYLLSVQENPDNDGRYLVADQVSESKAADWAWWDEYKKSLGIIEAPKPPLEAVEGGSASKNGKAARAK